MLRGQRFFVWWADHPGYQVCLLLLLSGTAAVGHLRPEWGRRAVQFVVDFTTASETTPIDEERGNALSDISSVEPPPEVPDVRPFQVGGGECVVVVIADDFFKPDSVRAIQEVVGELEQLPQVSEVLWLDEIPGLNLFGLPEPLLPKPTASTRQMSEARNRALQNPLAVGQLISGDGTTLLLHITLNWLAVTDNEATTDELREVAEAAAARYPNADFRFLVTGVVPLHQMTAENHIRNTWRYQLIGYTIMMISALLLFRGVAAVTMVAIAPALGVFWTMGWIQFFDLRDNPFNDIIVPVLISLVGLTDAVHLMVEIRNQRASGLDALHAARVGLRRVGVACVLTSLTTGIGFVSLSMAHHEVVRQFGWCCVLGVAMTLMSVLTVIPLGCRSPLGRRLHVGLGTSLVDRQLQRIGPLVGRVLQRDRSLSRIAIAATVVLVGICCLLRPDERRFSGLSESGEAAIGLRHLDRELGGLEFGYIMIRWPSGASQGDVLRAVSRVGEMLDQDPLLGHPLGIHSLLEALPGDGPPEERMGLLELLPPPLKRAFYTPERRTASVQFRIQDRGIAAYGDSFTRLEQNLLELADAFPGFGFEFHGEAAWRWKHVYRVVVDLATSLGTASVIIWLVLTCFYRSIRIGLISIVPNVFPLASTGAALVLLGQHLEIVTVCVFTICIGIAVDDTIHFLTRFREEQQAGGAHHDVIHRAFTGVGTALLMTTIVLVAGMGTAIFGDARDARLFGIMGCMTLTAALFADVIFLPALLKRYGPRN